MKIRLAIIGMTALASAALSTGASAMPIGPALGGIASNIDQVRLVCDYYGRCVRTRPRYYGYYGAPAYTYGYGGYGYGGGWGRRGWGYGRGW